MLTRENINLAAIRGEILAAPLRFYDEHRQPLPIWETFCQELGTALTAELANIAAQCPLFSARTLTPKPPRGHRDTCRHCGEAIVTKGPRFCSNKCETEHKRKYAREWAKANRKSRRKRRHAQTCPVCRAVFLAKRTDAVYCSATCRQRAKRGKSATEVAPPWPRPMDNPEHRLDV